MYDVACSLVGLPLILTVRPITGYRDMVSMMVVHTENSPGEAPVPVTLGYLELTTFRSRLVY